jgi:hypothetical protein
MEVKRSKIALSDLSTYAVYDVPTTTATTEMDDWEDSGSTRTEEWKYAATGI